MPMLGGEGMSATDQLLAKLGPKVARLPSGERRIAKSLLTVAPTLRRLKVAMEIRGSGDESMTRVHGSQTQSMDYDQMTPQDVAAALGFIRCPIARELFCCARWPDYRGDGAELRILLARRVMDEGQRRTDEKITAWLTAELTPTRSNRIDLERAQEQEWPMIRDTYLHLIALAMQHLDGSGLPSPELIAKAVGISKRRYYSSWRVVMDWIYDDFRSLVHQAECEFRTAIR